MTPGVVAATLVTVFTWLVVLFVGIAIIGAVAMVIRSAARGPGGGPAQTPAPPRMGPQVVDFHVRNDTAHVFFAVPLPDGDAGDHLRRLLQHEAIAVLREKRSHGLPLGGVRAVVAYGQRDGRPVEVARVDLPEGDTLPEVAVPELVPHAHVAGYDPLAHLGSEEFEVHPGVSSAEAEAGLPPLSQVVELPGPVEAALRARGVDPMVASLDALTLGLLDVAGYTVTPLAAGGTTIDGGDLRAYRASRGGVGTLVVVLEHTADSYPEVSERALNQVIMLASQQNMGGFLVTDKYGPYLMYDKERKSTVRFVTRERLQAFVDSFAL